jgi:serine/threonine-protein kinase
MPAEHAIHRGELEMLLAGLESTRFQSPGVLPVSPEGLEAIDAVGPYRLQRELGRGGMAAVWLATPLEPAGSPPVALKLPLVSFDASLFLERFARERAFLARLAHPHIAAFRDAGVAPSGQQYLAMEYVDGGPITDHCDARGLDVSQRLATFRQVVGAVEYAHRAGILHRDIKPSNILVTAGGEARLVDFGVAKVLVGGRAEATTLTEASGRPLTPAYASPEQVAGGTLTEASDVYSLGVVLYELLTGARPPSVPRSAPIAPPSAAVTADSGVARAEGGERRLSRRLVGELDHVVLKALRDAPGERYCVGRAAWPGPRSHSHRAARAAPAGAHAHPGQGLLRAPSHRRLARADLLATMSGLKAAHRAAADLQQLIEPPVAAAHQAVLVTIGPRIMRGCSLRAARWMRGGSRRSCAR